MRGRGTLAGLVTLVVAASLCAPAADAHVALVSSDPPDATSLTNVPRDVHLRFNEAVSSRFRQVRLLDAHGRRVAGTSVAATPDGRQLTLRLPAGLRRGAYEVTWEALSQNDGHVTGGAFVFGAGAAVGPAPRAAPASGASTLDSVLRWAWLTLVLMAIGVVGFGLVLRAVRVPRAPAARRRAQARLARTLAPAAGLAAAVGLAVLIREAATVPGDGSLLSTGATLLGERWGVLWLASEALLIAVAVVGLAVRRAPDRRGPWIASAALLVCLALAHVANGHAANVERPVAHVLAGAVHLLAAGLWLGGVAAFAVALWPTAGTSRHDAAVLARAVRTPFGALAGGALLVAVLTGLIAVGTQVASVDALLRTNYGESLLAKSALMAAAGLFGLANAVLLLRGGDHVASGRVSRLMAIEVALGIGALLAAAEMTASAPARGPEFGVPRPVRAPVLARQVKDVLVAATARPNRVGTNVFTVTTSDTRRIYGAPIRGVSIVLRPQAGGAPRTLQLIGAGTGRWTGGALLSGAGGWRMTVLVRRPGVTLAAPLSWQVEPADTVIPVRYSSRRLAPITNRIALVLASGAVIGLLLLLVARRRPFSGTRPLRMIGKDAI